MKTITNTCPIFIVLFLYFLSVSYYTCYFIKQPTTYIKIIENDNWVLIAGLATKKSIDFIYRLLKVSIGT